jgi:hypothetical protein
LGLFCYFFPRSLAAKANYFCNQKQLFLTSRYVVTPGQILCNSQEEEEVQDTEQSIAKEDRHIRDRVHAIRCQ